MKQTRRPKTVAFIDGEGIGRKPHRYVYLCCATADGQVCDIRNDKGLTTEQILDFLVRLPKHWEIYGFSLGYDKTMWFKDVRKHLLYLLYHPDCRKRRDGKGKGHTQPVQIGSYLVDMLSSKLQVQAIEQGIARKWWRRVVIWDVFRYYQESFAKAIGPKRWNIASVDELEHISRMKQTRSGFGIEDLPTIIPYCQEECRLGAKLVTQLVQAHDDIGLKTRSWYGPGTTAEAAMKKHKVDRHLKREPEWAHTAVMCAFSGGRFENTRLGIVDGPVHLYDISSAYPYQQAQLPCLKCGRWSYVEEASIRDIESANLACVHYRYAPKNKPLFSPFFFRGDDGTICYPYNHEGWVWKHEYLVARRGWSGVYHGEAILYHTACSHRPFGYLPRYYLERLKLGKEGRGLVLKLLVNSHYGKTAQSIGRPKFNSWVWAGNITSGCRAQILEAILRCRRGEDILYIATDGVASLSPIELPEPVDLGTGDWISPDGTRKPLGGWEHKLSKKGRLMVRPGLNAPWPIDTSDESTDDVRARGVGRNDFASHVERIAEAYLAGHEGYTLKPLTRFQGAKSCLWPNAKGREILAAVKERYIYSVYLDESCFERAERIGEWIEAEQVISFNPHPKRELGPNRELLVRNMGGLMSKPYNRGMPSPEYEAFRHLQDIIDEQPEFEDLRSAVAAADDLIGN